MMRSTFGRLFNKNWVLAATLVCGASVFTACSDDDDWWTLQGFKIGRKPTQSGVYIHHGKKVTIKQVK